MELPTEYNIFWRELRGALQAAESRTHKSHYVEAIRRLKSIEGEELGPGHGQTAYLLGVNPWEALRDYVAHIYDGAKAPFWLESAERG